MRPRPSTRALTLALIGVVAAMLVVAPAAFGGTVFPERDGSPNADDISTLYSITLYIGLIIFVGVEGALIWSLVRFRHKRGGQPPQQVRGNAPLEIGWTLGASVIVVLLAVITFVYLDDIKNPPRSGPNGLSSADGVEFAALGQPNPPGGDALNVEVNGQQYVWRYDYPGKEQLYSYHELVVPTDTTITLDITSSDVVHSWWAPKLGGKADAVPGHTNELWFKVKQPGVYQGVCAELCGDNHADMRTVVRAVTPDEFVAWARRQRRDIKSAQSQLATQRRFRESQQEEERLQ